MYYIGPPAQSPRTYLLSRWDNFELFSLMHFAYLGKSKPFLPPILKKPLKVPNNQEGRTGAKIRRFDYLDSSQDSNLVFRLLEPSCFFEGSQNDVRRLSFFPGRVAIAGPQGSGKRSYYRNPTFDYTGT